MKKEYLYIFLSVIFFSTMEIILKIGSGDFNPIQLNLLRFLIGAIILTPLALKHMKRSGFHLTRENLAFFAVTGFLCVVISMTFYQLAIVYASASTVAVLFSCNPLIIIPLAHFMLKEPLSRQTLWALAISAAGILCIVNPFDIQNPAGVFYALFSAVTFALYSVVGRKGSWQFNCDGVILTSFSFYSGSMQLLVFVLLSKIDVISSWLVKTGLGTFASVPILEGITWDTLPVIIYIGIFVTGLGFAFYFLAMDKTNASTASVVFFIKPALAPILAFLFLGETVTPHIAAGILFIVIGSGLTLFNQDSKQGKLRISKVKSH